MNDKFTDIADNVSDWAGRWQVVVASTIFIIIWLSLGPYFHWSDSWQLSMNSPITLVELYLAIFTLAAANRVEKRNRQLLEKIEAYEEQEIALLKKP